MEPQKDILEEFKESGDIARFLIRLRVDYRGLSRDAEFNPIVSERQYSDSGTFDEDDDSDKDLENRVESPHEIFLSEKGLLVSTLTLNEGDLYPGFYHMHDQRSNKIELYLLEDRRFLLAKIENSNRNQTQYDETDWSRGTYEVGFSREIIGKVYIYPNAEVKRDPIFRLMETKDPDYKGPLQKFLGLFRS